MNRFARSGHADANVFTYAFDVMFDPWNRTTAGTGFPAAHPSGARTWSPSRFDVTPSTIAPGFAFGFFTTPATARPEKDPHPPRGPTAPVNVFLSFASSAHPWPAMNPSHLNVSRRPFTSPSTFTGP